METSTIWRHVESQRLDVADLVESLGPDTADTPSLCRGWTVRHVAAHLTHATLPMPRLMREAARSGFRFDATVDRMALADDRPTAQIADDLRATARSRRHPPGTSAMEPLIDLLVHGQDICVPLGRHRPMPTDAATAAAERVWAMGFPFRARRRWVGRRLVATDAPFAVGEGREVVAPIADLLLALTGREVSIPG